MAKILIVDDDPDIVEAMKVVLTNGGHSVNCVFTASSVMKAMEEDKPDAVILDVMMESKSSGFGLAREIKADERYKNIPILMLTAVKQALGIDFRKEAGDEKWLPVDAFCEKPLSPGELLEKIGALLAGK